MGPIEPAAATAAILLATRALEALGGKVGETTWAGMSRLVDLVRRKLRGHRQAETALNEIAGRPDDLNRIRDLAAHLARLAAQDLAFRDELNALIVEARHDPIIGPMTNQIYGQAQIGQLFNIGQVRDIYYIQPPPASPRVITPIRSTADEEMGWPTREKPVTSLPARNRLFTGRANLLSQLNRKLGTTAQAAVAITAVASNSSNSAVSKATEAAPQVLHGLGGVGKTQLALEYAYRHASDYDIRWWVAAQQPAAIPNGLVALARRLGVPEQVEQAETIAVLLDELGRRGRWLLVFDNAEDPSDLRPYWPATSGGGHVLVTSRNPNWQAWADAVQVDVLPRRDAIRFLRRRTKMDEQAAAALATALGDLPLALEQASAYLEQTRTHPDEYLELLRTRARELFTLGRPATSKTIETTWKIGLDRIQLEAPAAQDLLSLCAFLAPEDIPRFLPIQHRDQLPERLAGAIADRLEYQQAIGALNRYSLLTLTDDTFSMHRLVQAVVRHALDDKEERSWAAAAVRLINAEFPAHPRQVVTWPACSRLLAHALSTADHARRLQVAPEATSLLLTRTAEYLWTQGEFAQVRRLREQILRIHTTRFGDEHPEVARSLDKLGAALRLVGALDEARDAHERALALMQSSPGDNDLEIAEILNNLGVALRTLDDYPAARTALEQALAIRQARLGRKHPDTAETLNNLGTVLRSLDSTNAKATLERALAIREAHLGPDHPDTAETLTNLGNAHADLQELDPARAALERAQAILERHLGPNHPDVAYSLSSLGGVLRDLGRLREGQAALERALEIREARLGPDHRYVGYSANGLGLVHHRLGDLSTAQAYLERALAIYEDQLGHANPTTAQTLNNLGHVLMDSGDLPGARAYFERALAVFEASLGANHRKTNPIRKKLAEIEGNPDVPQ